MIAIDPPINERTPVVVISFAIVIAPWTKENTLIFLMDVCHIFSNICNSEVIILIIVSLLEFRGGLKAL